MAKSNGGNGPKNNKVKEAITTEAITVTELPEIPMSVSRPPEVVLAEAQRAAQALTTVIKSKKKKPVMFAGEQYLEYEDWQTVGRFYGITAKVEKVAYVEYGDHRGFEARASAILAPSGQVISAAEAICLDDEANWAHKPLYQLKSMSQTRACAKALRNVLAWVVVLAGYRATPAEEMPPELGDREPIKPPQRASTRVTVKPSAVSELTPEPVSGADWADRTPPPQPEPRRGPIYTQPPEPILTPESPRPSPMKINEKQQRLLFHRNRKSGHSEIFLKEFLKQKYGIDHTKDIPVALFNEILDAFGGENG